MFLHDKLFYLPNSLPLGELIWQAAEDSVCVSKLSSNKH